jgi:hypothetical protein
MGQRNIKESAVLIGFSPEGKCVYSEIIPLHDYWDGEHVWDSGAKIKKIRLVRLSGYLFDAKGHLLQEFESNFDLMTGAYQMGWNRHADGTFVEHQ